MTDNFADFADILSSVIRALNPPLGPFEVDGWTYVTDRVGFLAFQGTNLHSAAVKYPTERHAITSRQILALAGSQLIKLGPIRAFIDERCAREREDGCIECSIFGRTVDARALNKWIELLPFDECKIAPNHAPTTQKESGESLLFEGDGWKFLIAGLMPSLKYPPTYSEQALEATHV